MGSEHHLSSLRGEGSDHQLSSRRDEGSYHLSKEIGEGSDHWCTSQYREKGSAHRLQGVGGSDNPEATKLLSVRPPRVPWAEVTWKPAASALPYSLHAHLKLSRQALTSLVSPSAKTIIMAAYFGGVPRGPIGALIRVLLLPLPNWVVLEISFIGNTALYILCHTELVERLIAMMKLLSFRHLEKYDPRGRSKGSGSALATTRADAPRKSCHCR